MYKLLNQNFIQLNIFEYKIYYWEQYLHSFILTSDIVSHIWETYC